MTESRLFDGFAESEEFFPGCLHTVRESTYHPLRGKRRARNVAELISTALLPWSPAPAIEFEGRSHSRAEVADLSDRLAFWLLRNGVHSESLIGIYMQRSLSMLIAVLAVLKAGAAYVPLDPEFPRSRNQGVLEDTGLSVLLTDTSHRSDLHAPDMRVLALDDASEPWQQETVLPLPAFSSEQRAYVIFTSGSTGRPKGVEVNHRGVVNLLVDLEHRLDMTAKDRLVAVTTLAFDISVLELLLPLVCGGTVVLASRADAADGVALARLIANSRATALQATPFTWRLLLAAGFEPPRGFKMMCGGEAWPASLAYRLLATGGTLWNMYGPTETTVWSSVTEVFPEEKQITIGLPLANTRFYVLDDTLRPVPRGEPGELYIAGDGLARGYFNRPQLTEERFVPDFLDAGQRMYRSGDQVRELSDGRFQFLGRRDQQVKFRGFRIELGEIEGALRSFPGILEAVAVLRGDREGEPMLAGYFTAGQTLDVAQLRVALRSHLPHSTTPELLLQVAELPRTNNGKLDRRALLKAEWLPHQPMPPEEPVAGRLSEVERSVRRVWQELFPGEVLTENSDFFELGGDSLLFLKLQSIVTRDLGTTLTLGDAYRYPTLAAFARWVEEQRITAPAPDGLLNRRLIPLRTGRSETPLFLLPQMMLYEPLSAELGENQTVYALELLEEDVSSGKDQQNFQQLAQLYYEVIREVQPAGPYRLGGWCMWGSVAYELGRMLEHDGETVDLVILMDSWAPMYWQSQSRTRKMLLPLANGGYRMRWFMGRLWDSDMQQRVTDVRRWLQNAAASAGYFVLRKERPRTRVQRVLVEALTAYAGGPLRGRVLLFKGDRQPRGLVFEKDLGWERVVGHPVLTKTLPERESIGVMSSTIRDCLNTSDGS